jgi:hypothetical protein
MQMDEAVPQSNAAIDRMKLIPLSLEHTGGVGADSITAVDSTKPIAKVELFTGIVDEIAELRHANYR